MELSPKNLLQLLWAFLLVSCNYDVAAFGCKSSLNMMTGERRESPLLSASPSATSVQPTGVNSTHTIPTIKKAKRIQKAPLVDSTLLRFLSAQKSEITEITKIGDEDDAISLLQQQMNKTLSIVNETKIQGGNEDISVGNAEGDDLIISATMSNEMKEDMIVKSSWFTEYDAQNVASKLKGIGASVELAMEAGHSVNQYAIARTTRQRVRKFLSDRDAIWATSKVLVKSKKERIGSSAEGSSDLLDSLGLYSNKVNTYSLDSAIDLLVHSGLTGKDIASILVHTPSISMMKARNDENSSESFKGETLETTLNRSYFGVLCDTIKLRKYDARKVLRSCPGLLTKRGSLSSEEVIKMLASLGASPTSLRRDKAALPILLSRSPASLFRLVSFLCSDAVRMPVNMIGFTIRQAKCASLLDQVAPLPSNKILMGERDAESGKINELPVQDLLNRNDNRLEMKINSMYKNMFETAKYLRSEIDVHDVGKVVLGNPNVLMLDIDRDIVPKLEFLHFKIGIEFQGLSTVIESFPLILEYDVKKMEEVVDYMLSLGVKEEVLGSIFRAFPALLTQDKEEKMKPAVAFLKDIGITNIGRFVTRLPPVLGYSVENELMPKWGYLKTVSRYPVFDVIKFPAYFAYPLERVMSRYSYLLDVKQIPIQLLSIDNVLPSGDNDFAITVALDENGSEYAKHVSERNTSKRSKKKKPNRRKKLKAER